MGVETGQVRNFSVISSQEYILGMLAQEDVIERRVDIWFYDGYKRYSDVFPSIFLGQDLLGRHY